MRKKRPMRLMFFLGLGLCVAGAGLFGALLTDGPLWRNSPAISYQISAKDFDLATVEQTIKDAEAQIADIRPGLEKSISWAGNPQTRTRFAIVYIHGFSASKEELRPVPDQVAAALGANIFFTRLTGHGRTNDAMRAASVAAWLADIDEAFRVGTTIGDQVIIISCSTGGTLAAYGVMSQMFSQKLAGVVFFAPNFGVQEASASLLTWPFAAEWAPLIAGETQTNTPRNAWHAKYWTTSYPTVSLIPMMELIAMATTGDRTPRNLPALFYFSPDDRVVDPQETEKFIKNWNGPKTIVRVAGDDSEDELNHLITGQVVSPSQIQRAVDSVIDWHNAHQ